MRFDIVTFGSAVVDVFIHTDIAEKENFISYPIGAKILIKDLKFDIGGGGTNTAVAFARLGLKTGFIGRVGKDDNGKEILKLMKKENVRFLGKKDKNNKTGYSVILDSRGGDRTILTYKGANDNISIEDIKLRRARKSKWIYYSSLLGKSLETQTRLARIMKKRGSKLAFNPSSYLTKRKRLIMPLLRMADILILNKEEAQMIVGKRAKDLLKSLHGITKGIIVITDKNNKIQAYTGRKKYYLKPHKVKVVERTGAGDAFASGFVAGQVAGWSIEKSLKLGLRESESVIRYFGAKNKLLRIKLK